MREATRRTVALVSALLGSAWSGWPIGSAAWANDGQPSESVVAESRKPGSRDPTSAAGTDHRPLILLPTQAELREMIRNYERKTGKIVTAPIHEEEVVVTAPGELAPMRDVSQDVPGGIAAPFWAITHPKDAWRIFVPIPPKGRLQEEQTAPPDER